MGIKDLFSDLLNETKGFKSQITVKVLLKNYKLNGEIEFDPIYFNSVTKTVRNYRFKLENSFQEILYMIDNWINEGSCWIVKSVESQYINISTYRPLLGSSYISLPEKLNNPRKGLINIKSKDQKCILWFHVRHINPSKEHPGRIKKKMKKHVKHITNPEEIREEDKELISDLDYDGIEFPVQENDFSEIELKNNIFINVFAYKNELVFLIYVSDQKFKDSLGLLLFIDDDKSHYVYIKDFNIFMFHKTKNKNKQ